MNQNYDRNECSICLEELNDSQSMCILQCKHRYHAHCIITYINNQIKNKLKLLCPLCQKEFYIIENNEIINFICCSTLCVCSIFCIFIVSFLF
jgi:hypothetical protein